MPQNQCVHPNDDHPDKIKDRFCEELIPSVPQSDKLIILGDFNAHVRTDHQAWQNVIGKTEFANVTAMASCSLDFLHFTPVYH